MRLKHSLLKMELCRREGAAVLLSSLCYSSVCRSSWSAGCVGVEAREILHTTEATPILRGFR